MLLSKVSFFHMGENLPVYILKPSKKTHAAYFEHPKIL